MKKIKNKRWWIERQESITGIAAILVIFLFVVSMLALYGFLERDTPGVRVNCEAECTVEDMWKINQCYMQAKDFGVSTSVYTSPSAALGHFTGCVKSKGFRAVDCIISEKGCRTFSALTLKLHRRRTK